MQFPPPGWLFSYNRMFTLFYFIVQLQITWLVKRISVKLVQTTRHFAGQYAGAASIMLTLLKCELHTIALALLQLDAHYAIYSSDKMLGQVDCLKWLLAVSGSHFPSYSIKSSFLISCPVMLWRCKEETALYGTWSGHLGYLIIEMSMNNLFWIHSCEHLSCCAEFYI